MRNIIRRLWNFLILIQSLWRQWQYWSRTDWYFLIIFVFRLRTSENIILLCCSEWIWCTYIYFWRRSAEIWRVWERIEQRVFSDQDRRVWIRKRWIEKRLCFCAAAKGIQLQKAKMQWLERTTEIVSGELKGSKWSSKLLCRNWVSVLFAEGICTDSGEFWTGISVERLEIQLL